MLKVNIVPDVINLISFPRSKDATPSPVLHCLRYSDVAAALLFFAADLNSHSAFQEPGWRCQVSANPASQEAKGPGGARCRVAGLICAPGHGILATPRCWGSVGGWEFWAKLQNAIGQMSWENMAEAIVFALLFAGDNKIIQRNDGSEMQRE